MASTRLGLARRAKVGEPRENLWAARTARSAGVKKREGGGGEGLGEVQLIGCFYDDGLESVLEGVLKEVLLRG